MIRVAESDADVDRWLEIRNEVFPAIALTRAAVDQQDRSGPPGRAKLLADAGGFAIVSPPNAEHPRAFVTVGVLPEARRQGVGGALWTAGTERLAALGIARIHSLSMEGEEDGARFLERRGFEIASRDKALERDLAIPLPPRPPLPDDVTLAEIAFSGEQLRAVYEVETETLNDVPGEEDVQMVGFDDWTVELAAEGEPLIVGAFADGALVGIAIVAVAEAPAGSALHWMTAVRRPYRRRGIARALKHASLELARAHGVQVARTFNEARNVGMRHLNEEYGYVPAADLLRWEGPCSG